MGDTNLKMYPKEHQIRSKRILNVSTGLQMLTEARRYYYKGNQLLYGVLDAMDAQLVTDYESCVERIDQIANGACREIEDFVRRSRDR